MEQTPFTLTLRLWDIYILEGERVLTAMAYTILKLHKSKCPARWGGSEPLRDELPRSHQPGDRVWCSAQVSPSQCCHPKAVFCLQLERLPAQSPPSESLSFGSKTEGRAAGGGSPRTCFVSSLRGCGAPKRKQIITRGPELVVLYNCQNHFWKQAGTLSLAIACLLWN